MGELAAALELLHSATLRVGSLTATLVEWIDEERTSRAADAYARRQPSSFGVLTARHGPGEPAFRQYEQRTQLHYAAPSRYRLVQQASDYVHRPNDLLVVSDGGREWTFDMAGPQAYVQSPNRHSVFDLIDPSWLAAACVLSIRQRSTYEERQAIELHGARRTQPIPSGRYDFELGAFADELDAVIDAETGLLLSLTRYFDGAPYEIKRLTEVDVNPPIGDEPFTFVPPPGTQIHDLGAHPPRPPWRFRLGARYHLMRLRRHRRGD